MKPILLIIVITFSSLLASCSTLQSNWGMGSEEPHQLGHVYSGTTHNLGSWCIVKEEKLSIGMKGFNFIVNAIDFPLSLVVDTLFLPVDLMITPEYNRSSSEKICEVHTKRLK